MVKKVKGTGRLRHWVELGSGSLDSHLSVFRELSDFGAQWFDRWNLMAMGIEGIGSDCVF